MRAKSHMLLLLGVYSVPLSVAFHERWLSTQSFVFVGGFVAIVGSMAALVAGLLAFRRALLVGASVQLGLLPVVFVRLRAGLNSTLLAGALTIVIVGFLVCEWAYLHDTMRENL